MLRLVAFACVVFVALAVPERSVAEETLTPFQAEYKVRMKGLRGEMRMSLALVDDLYEAVSTIRPKGIARIFARGSLTESSAFVLRDSRVAPVRYQSEDSLARDPESSYLDFDWQMMRATGADNDGEIDHPIDATTYDRVSIQYALMLDLLNGQDSRDYTMLDGARFKELEVRLVGNSTLRVPYGEFDVVGIQHQARNSSRVTTLWCARDLGFLPIRIEQHRKGKRIVLADMTDYST